MVCQSYSFTLSQPMIIFFWYLEAEPDDIFIITHILKITSKYKTEHKKNTFKAKYNQMIDEIIIWHQPLR